MSADDLTRAAATLRALAEAAQPERGHWHVRQFLPEDRDYEHQAQVMTDQKRESYGFVASNVFIDDARFIAAMHPGVALALADWLDAEVAVQESMQPLAELVSVCVEQEGGPAGYVRIVHDDEGNPEMQADSSPAAHRLAALINGDTR